MSVIRDIRCDMCSGTIEQLAPFIQIREISWGDSTTRRRLDFCSKKCLIAYIEKKLEGME